MQIPRPAVRTALWQGAAAFVSPGVHLELGLPAQWRRGLGGLRTLGGLPARIGMEPFRDATRRSRCLILSETAPTLLPGGVRSLTSMTGNPTAAEPSTKTNESNQSSKARPYYLDYQATTPLDPRVLDEMLPFCVDQFGNPHSRTHVYGWEAEQAVDAARADIAALIGARAPKEIIFTSGATESNNLAIKGVAGFFGIDPSTGKRNHIITTQTEHKCVLASCRDLQERFGWDVTFLPVGKDGLLDLKLLEDTIRPGKTALVSVMHVNNEIGVVQPVAEIGRICKTHGVFFHSDAAQACGKIPVNVEQFGIDLLSISGHKIYGPKGVGALYVRSLKPRVRLTPVISGGGQERGLRSGTIPTFLAVGLGAACRLAAAQMENDTQHVHYLAKKLFAGIVAQTPRVTLNGSATHRYLGNVNLSFEAVEGESLLMALRNVALSSGSACTSASLEPSYVLRAIGVGEDLAHTSIRFGFGRFTTEAEVDECIQLIVNHVQRLREMSPLWEAVESGDTSKPVWT